MQVSTYELIASPQQTAHWNLIRKIISSVARPDHDRSYFQGHAESRRIVLRAKK
jgi:hypothetical protein